MGSAKIKLDKDLVERASRHAEQAGYSSVEEFITHLVEKALAAGPGEGDSEEEIKEKLRGLGYIS